METTGSMRSARVLAAVFAAGAAAALAPSGLAAGSGSVRPAQSCFRLSQLQNTRADGQQRIYARVGVNDVFRIDLAHRCSSLPFATHGLVLTPTAGQDMICGPLDLDLKVNDGAGLEPCMIKSITRLTPEEAAAVPAKSRP